MAEGLVALLVTLYTTAGQMGVTSPARADAWLQDAFASGAADARALRDIAARADDYYQDALHKAVEGKGQDAARPVNVPRASRCDRRATAVARAVPGCGPKLGRPAQAGRRRPTLRRPLPL